MNDEPTIDTARSAACGDDGWVAAVVVYPDGEERLWLLAPEPGDPGCACVSCAPHDRITADADRRRLAR